MVHEPVNLHGVSSLDKAVILELLALFLCIKCACIY